jgi:tetratricopeptide (TPR) repeat protein
MFKLKFFIAVLAVGVSGIVAVQAQNSAPVRGVVQVRKADGSQTPAAGATVESYRVDLGKGAGPSTTTNKKGEFSFVGFQLGATYALAVSGPGLSPVVESTVKAGNENVTIIVSEGDGRKPSEDEVRQFVATSANLKPVDAKTAAKENEEYQKKLAAYNEQKKKAEDSNKIVNAAFQEGDKLFKAKDYDGAIAKFDEGINADPEFEGSAPILLNYKATALKNRALDTFNKSVAAGDDPAVKAAALDKVKADLLASAGALEKGLTILKNAPAPADAAAQKSADTSRKNILTNYIEVYRLLVKTRADIEKGKEAGPIYTQYLAVETDPAAKIKAQLSLAEIMEGAGDAQGAIDAYTAVLQSSPDNVDALAGMGLNLINLAYLNNNDKVKFQEGVNYLQKFVGVAPEGHKFKADAQALIDALKKEQNVTPQKVTSPPRKRP